MLKSFSAPWVVFVVNGRSPRDVSRPVSFSLDDQSADRPVDTAERSRVLQDRPQCPALTFKFGHALPTA
jgi:hypothetical protein